MASPQYNKQHRPKESFGQKVKNVSETLGAIKGIYETGKWYIVVYKQQPHILLAV